VGSLSFGAPAVVTMVIHRKQTTQADVDEAKKKPGQKLFAGPLSGLTGKVVLSNTGYGAETIPIEKGKIDFGRATPYIIGIDKKGIYATEFKKRLTKKGLPGTHETEGTHGKLYLQELVEESANKAPTVDTEAPKEDPIELELESDGITLGKGKMGVSKSGTADADSFWIELPDASGGENTIIIPKHKIGEQIELNIPKFHAKGGAFPGGQIGDIALDLGINITNLAKLDLTISITVNKGEIQNIGFGDAGLSLDNEALKKLPPPTLKDVNPKAAEGQK
jgi:hypothetical protein